MTEMRPRGAERRGGQRRQVPRREDDRRALRHQHRLNFVRENWYRDVWLILISIFVVITTFRIDGVASNLVITRRTAVADACKADNAQADVIRAILDVSLQQQAQYQKHHRRLAGTPTIRQEEKLIDTLLAPLGGLHPSKAVKQALCDIRIARGTPGGG